MTEDNLCLMKSWCVLERFMMFSLDCYILLILHFHILFKSYESAAACYDCAERSGDSEGCANQCRINAELAGVTARLISLKAPEVNALMNLVIESSQNSQHKNDHCQACAAAARSLGDNLRNRQARTAA
ncbi:4214_t:CDS:2 [Cetraspora pellucida]|uniref:4214_t:CDS:1 n=1 Tax=Cetraspora pellucida TaxID=1433469 RepID=A0A9N9FP98_9GLOM|nr:4214_t:CDS:2 [Cetraspora pellucida]